MAPVVRFVDQTCHSAHRIYIKLEEVSNGLQGFKMSVNSSDQKFLQVKAQIESKQIHIFTEGLLSVDQLDTIALGCSDVQDFNRARSNKDR